MKRYPGFRSTARCVAAVACVLMLLSLSCVTADDKKAPEPPQLPGVKIDREKKVVELEGKIVLPLQADWLELLACAPKSREHESIITIDAKPSHIHGALLLIGLKPGKPAWAERVNDELKIHPATGDPVAVTILYKDKDSKQVEVKASDWIIEQETKKKLPDNIWLFTGSRMYQVDGKEIYGADVEGNIFSLVNFGDEVLARKTRFQGGQGGGGGDTWGANTKAIPPIGTKVTVRLRPAKKEKD